MEGGAFIEWDFLRGVREGWFPKMQSPNVYSESVYGTCEEILDRTVDDRSIIHPYPAECENDTSYWDPEGLSYQFDLEHQVSNATGTDDDVIISIGHPDDASYASFMKLLAVVGISVAFFCWRSIRRSSRNRKQYTEIRDLPLRECATTTLKV
jgi:hypothetical protein